MVFGTVCYMGADVLAAGMKLLEAKARELCMQAGQKPDKTVPNYRPGGLRIPLWVFYKERAKEELTRRKADRIRFDKEGI